MAFILVSHWILRVSKDILTRWTYPLVPDENNPSGQAYEYRRGNVYMPSGGGGSSVQLSRYVGFAKGSSLEQ